MKKPLAWARTRLNYEFADEDLLIQAITHRSYSNQNNERLEFLGDSVLGHVIAEALFRREIQTDEGGLTRLRALLVRGKTLAEIARELGLGDIMRLGSGESRGGDHQRDSILADGLEALFGAVLLDGGIESARQVILHLYADRLDSLPAADELKDPKSRLQERLQGQGMPLPEYVVTSEAGPPHNRRFEVLCKITELQIETSGAGSSRRMAEQQAAEAALLQLTDD